MSALISPLTRVDEVVRTIAELAARSSGRIIVGVSGAPGSGKSTLCAQLVEALGTYAVLLPMDGFHLPQARLVQLGRRDRMGAPDTFDVDGFISTLHAVRAADLTNTAVAVPGFDRESEEAVAGAITIAANADIVVVDGNYLLLATDGWAEVAPLLDLTFFIDLDQHIRHSRLIERHIRYGKSVADATAWALGPDEANAKLIAATAANADHLIRLTPSLLPLDG